MQAKKKRMHIIILTVAAVVLAAALLFVRQRSSSGNMSGEDADPYSEISVLPMEKVSAFCAGDDGILYICHYGESIIRAYNTEGKCTASYPVVADRAADEEERNDGQNWEERINAGSVQKLPGGADTDNVLLLRANEEANGNDGSQLETTASALRCLCYAANKIYCYRSSTDSYLCLDLNSGDVEVIWKNENVQAYEIAVSGDMAAILYGTGEIDDCDRSIGDGRIENYWCSGERIGLLNLRTLEWKALEYHNLVTVAAMGEHGFLIEGFDGENGFYLAQLDREGVMGERRATGFRENVFLAWDEEHSMFHGTGAFSQERKCSSGTMEQPEKAYRYWNNELTVWRGGVRYAGGYLYLLDSPALMQAGGRITRLKPELFFREAEPLKAYLCSTSSEPDWQGYPVEVETLRSEELALRLLAGDSDFDLVVMDSGMSEAWNIKRVKAYVPLEAVLAEPLSACFDGVRQFAVDGDAVWALPLSMNLQSLVYSGENLRKAGADVAELETMPGLVGIADVLKSSGWSGWYAASFGSIQIYLLQDYLAGGTGTDRISFNTPEFAAVLDAVQEYIGRKSLMGDLTFRGSEERYWEIYDRILSEGGNTAAAREAAEAAVYEACLRDILFDMITWQDASEYDKFIGREQFDIRPIPGMDAEEKDYAAWMDMLVVNPASPRREQALKLVESIAKAQFSDPKNYLSADRSLYPGDSFSEALYHACEQAVVRESLPQEVYETNFMKILNGEVSREEGIRELERVVNAYLFE